MTTGSIKNDVKDGTGQCADDNIAIADGKCLKKTKDPCNKNTVSEEIALDWRPIQHICNGSIEIPENWSDMTIREQRDWAYVQITRHMPNQPKSLHFLIIGGLTRGDCGRPASARPVWLDREKFKRGQQFAEKHVGSIFLAQAVFLFGAYAFEHDLKPLIVSGKSSDPFTSFKRYLSTGIRIKHWYSSDPWTEGTPAYKDIQIVRRMHANIRNKMMNLSVEELEEASTIEKTWSCTKSTLLEDFRDSCPAAWPGQCPAATFSSEQQCQWTKELNQAEMSVIEAAFVAFVILRPEHFGIHNASDEDLDAFCHVWRGLGYLLGLEDEFNFCNGTLQEVKQRSQDLLQDWIKPNLRNVKPEWEHMLRCFVVGIQYYFPLITYEHVVLYLGEMLNIRLPRLEASLSYSQRFSYKFIKIVLLWVTRLPGVVPIMNRIFMFSIERGLKYTPDKLEKMKKHSTITMSKGIELTAAMQSNLAKATV